MARRIDLTRCDGTYSKELRFMAPHIITMANEPSITLEDMLVFVLGVIEPAYINANAKKRFVESLYKCETKIEINTLCHNAVVHGMYYLPRHKTK